jgi:hypothetical protein
MFSVEFESVVVEEIDLLMTVDLQEIQFSVIDD